MILVRSTLVTIFSLLLFSSVAQTPFDIAIEHVKRSADYSPLDLEDIIVTDQYQTAHNGLTHIYLRQRKNGIEISGANVNYNIFEDGAINSFGGNFYENIDQRINTAEPTVSQTQALQAALSLLEIETEANLVIIENLGGDEQKIIFDKSDFALENIPVRLIYANDKEDNLRLAWEISIYEKSAENWWFVTLDAVSGELLQKLNLVVHCDFEKGFNYVSNQPFANLESIISIKQNATVAANSYRVYAMPVESPSHGNRSLQISPWTQAGDGGTLGWHDDGSNESDYTKGNNVDAYEDNNNSNSPSGGNNARAYGGVLREFDFPLDLEEDPLTQQDPIITNLFYWNNIMHDVMYQYGFDEPSGNFQENNLGRGGAGSDYVYAEAQDNINGPGNNANFYTPSDGSNPRMQMYLWDNPAGDSLDVNSPGNVSGAYIMALANFGGDLDSPVTGDVVEVDDGSGNPSLGCNALINGGEISGNIALIDRGTCQFGTKCLNAQNAGAIAVIVCNNVGGNPINMGGGNDGNQVNIPAVMIRQDDCATIRQELVNGLNVTMVDSDVSDLDSDLDNGVIIHEYTHGISNRLTGGPGTTNCLGNAEQMGEGWSDFFAIWMTTQPNDNHDDPRGMGTYLLGEPNNGNGIRPTPYSTSFSINASTYGDITNTSQISQPHGIGYLWCSMIWDLNWALINAHGYDSNFYNSSGSAGNIIAMQLIIDGLKGQPCSPGFEDGRDAILAADQANNNGENTDIIWNVFARRGMGYSASQGSRYSRSDGNEAFDLPPGVPTMTEEELFEITPLPVELLAFNAVSNDRKQQIELFWNTASESNNRGFEILRKAEIENNFRTIGWINGAGESFTIKNYTFIDEEVSPNTQYYYQLRQVDFDGTNSLSDIVTAKLNGLNAEIQVFPNPTTDVVSIKMSSSVIGRMNLSIYDARGRLIDNSFFNANGNTEFEVDFSNQAEGVYFIQVEFENQTISKRVVVKR